MSYKNMQDDVSLFMTTFKQWDGKTLLNTPKPQTEEELEVYKLRLRLIIEETFELFKAVLDEQTYNTMIAPSIDSINFIIDVLTIDNFEVKKSEVLDSLVDQDYVNLGFANLLGLPLTEGWAEVQRSNMSKLDENGEPLFREDGKVLKSELYSPADLESVVENHSYVYENPTKKK